MEIKGKIISILPLGSGTSAKGAWKKQEYILQTTEQYPKKICFVVWGDKIDEYAIQNNDSVEVSIDIESREFNGKWYTDVKAWKVVKNPGSGSAEPVSSYSNNRNPEDSLPPLPPEPPTAEEMADDLPF
jgi:hypothetical protein